MYNMTFTIECLEHHKTVGLNVVKMFIVFKKDEKKCRSKKQNIYLKNNMCDNNINIST